MSRDYWEKQYQIGDAHWDKGAPSPGLVDFLTAHPDLPRGTVCVPGCGTGHDVREFAKAGFDVFGFDIAPSAIQLATKKTMAARKLGAPASCRQVAADRKQAGKMPALPGGLKAKFQLADFLHDEPPQLFDWIFEHTLFCAIQPEERGDYVRAVRRWLKPDGQYLAVNYLIVEHAGGPPFPVTRNELWERFSPHLDLVSDWIPRSYPNRAGRERMFWWRRTGAHPDTVLVAQPSPAASSRSVPLRGRIVEFDSRGETPPEPAGVDARATTLPTMPRTVSRCARRTVSERKAVEKRPTGG